MGLLSDHDDARRPVLVIGALAAVLRLLWVLMMSRVPRGLNDLTLYPAAAEGIARGRGYLTFAGTPTAYYPPGYPLFLAVIQWVLDRVGLGDHLVLAAGVVQALLGGVTAGAVVVVGRRLGGNRVGVIAGLLVACWPNLVVHSSLMLSESLFLAVFAVLLAAVVSMWPARSRVAVRAAGALPDAASVGDGATGWARASTRTRTGVVLTAGLAMGLCTLIRPQSALLVLPAIALAWALARPGRREWAGRVAVLVIGVVLVVGPWTVRNAVVLDAFVPVSTNTGDNLCMGFNPDASGGFMLAEYCETGEFYTDGPAAEVRRDREARHRATTWALENPGRLPALSWDKLRITYADDRDGLAALESFGEDLFLSDGTRRALGITMDLWFFGVLALACTGAVLLVPSAWRHRTEDPTGLLVLAVTLASVVVPVAAFGDTRFKVPVAPCFALLAAFAVVSARRLLAGRTHSGDAAPGDPAAGDAADGDRPITAATGRATAETADPSPAETARPRGS
jgi:4-amino-4-deoxy-L-arabinose transferase-like glycosyltransferase